MLVSSFNFAGTVEGLLEGQGGCFGGFLFSLLSESEPLLRGFDGHLCLKTVLIISSAESELMKESLEFLLGIAGKVVFLVVPIGALEADQLEHERETIQGRLHHMTEVQVWPIAII